MIHIRIKWVVIMWCKVKSYKVIGINLEQVWQVWSDVTNWHIWQKDIKSATIDGLFITGSQIKLKLQDDSIITMSLTEVKPYERFMDLTKFFLARMYATHEFIIDGDILEFRDTFKIYGILGFFWRKLILEKVIDSDQEQTVGLIKRVIELHQVGEVKHVK
mgnify:CR=1 FL=1